MKSILQYAELFNRFSLLKCYFYIIVVSLKLLQTCKCYLHLFLRLYSFGHGLLFKKYFESNLEACVNTLKKKLYNR